MRALPMRWMMSIVFPVIFATAFSFGDVKVGDQLPKLKAGALYNNSYGVDIKDLDGYVVVVEFWATWCGPCRAAIPHMNEIFEKYKDKGVLIISLSDENDATVKPFVKQMKMKYLVASGSKSIDDFGVNGIPHAFLTDTKGKVIWAGHPMAGLEESIENAVKEFKPVRRLGGGPAWNAHLLDEIELSIKEKNYGAAREELHRLDVKSMHPENPKDELAARYVKAVGILAKMAESDYEMALQDVDDKKFDEAIATLKSLAVEFSTVELGKKSAELLDRIENDPTIAKERKLVTLEVLAGNALKRARTLLEDGNTLSAYHRLNSIVKKYPDTDASVQAEKLLDTMRKDEAVMKNIGEDQSGG